MRAAFWIAVGVLREREVRRWVVRFGERPRVVKFEKPSGRGALDGIGGESSIVSGSLHWGLEEGLEVKREEMTSVWGAVIWGFDAALEFGL